MEVFVRLIIAEPNASNGANMMTLPVNIARA